jgi:hypothetical protein
MKTLILATCIAASLGAAMIFADEPKPEGRGEAPAARRPEAGAERRPEGGPGRFFPGAEVLTQEEREKLRAAQAKVEQDHNVQLAQAAVRDAMKALSDARDAATLAADPSLEPTLKKLKEAREKAMQGFRRPGDGERPRDGEGRRPGVRDGDKPKAEGDQPKPRDGEQPRRGEGDRPKARDGEQPKRGEGDQPK